MSPHTTTFLRGCVKHCAVCGKGRLFRHWFRMLDRCPRCDLKFERMEGHMSGEVGINTIVSFGTLMIVLFVFTFTFWPEPPIPALIGTAAAAALIGPFVYYPFSKTIWLAIDVMMRPIEPGEVRPEFLPPTQSRA